MCVDKYWTKNIKSCFKKAHFQNYVGFFCAKYILPDMFREQDFFILHTMQITTQTVIIATAATAAYTNMLSKGVSGVGISGKTIRVKSN